MGNVSCYFCWRLVLAFALVFHRHRAVSDDSFYNGSLLTDSNRVGITENASLHHGEETHSEGTYRLTDTGNKRKQVKESPTLSATTSTTFAHDIEINDKTESADSDSSHKGDPEEVVTDGDGAGLHEALMAPVGMKRGSPLHVHSKALSDAEKAAKEASAAHVEAEADAKAAAKADAMAANKYAARAEAEGEAKAEAEAEAEAAAKAKSKAVEAHQIVKQVAAEVNSTLSSESNSSVANQTDVLKKVAEALKKADAEARERVAAKIAAEKKLEAARNATRAAEAEAKQKTEEKEEAEAKAKAIAKMKVRAEMRAKEERERQEAAAKGKAEAEAKRRKKERLREAAKQKAVADAKRKKQKSTDKTNPALQDEVQHEGADAVAVLDDSKKSKDATDVGVAHHTSGEHESISDPIGMKKEDLRPSTTVLASSTIATTTTTESSIIKALPSTTMSTTTAAPVESKHPEPQSSTLLVNMSEGVVENPTLAMPSDWSRIERSGEFAESPYISQKHLDKLWQFLFTGYYKDVPPVPSDGGPLPVGVGINFVKFKDFDEVSGTINILLNLRLCWNDERLSFNTTDFFGVQWEHGGDKLPVRSGLLWTPDVVVLNEVDNFGEDFESGSTPLVLVDDAFKKETGVNVLWSRPLDVHSKCNVDMSLYPFDVQRCDIIIGSWAASRRQMLLVTQPFFAEHTVHTSEFQVKDIAVTKRVVYTRAVAQSFTEIVYTLVLERYPHYYVINFILPMVAITLLTISTMWMSPSNIGPRVNSSTKLLLCIVSIMFITARNRPAIHGDIWLDRFQSHCLALSMSAVLESFFVDYLSKMTVHISWFWRVDVIDSLLRTLICAITAVVIFSDACQVDQNSALTLYTSVNIDSTGLLVAFVYIIFFGLGLSSVFTIIWFILPRRLQHKIVGKDDDHHNDMEMAGYVSDGSEPAPRPWPADIGHGSPLEDLSKSSKRGRYSKIPTEVGITSARIQKL